MQSRDYQNFAKKLRQARIEAGFTQVQIAKKLQRPQSYISNIEAGQQRVDVAELKIFAKLYNKEYDYFLK